MKVNKESADRKQCREDNNGPAQSNYRICIKSNKKIDAQTYSNYYENGKRGKIETDTFCLSKNEKRPAEVCKTAENYWKGESEKPLDPAGKKVYEKDHYTCNKKNRKYKKKRQLF